VTAPRIGVFTTLAYESLPPERLALFRDYLLYSLKRQVYGGFDLIIVTRSDRNRKVLGKGSEASDAAIAALDYGTVPHRLVAADSVPFADYPIQIRVDSDDILLPTFTLKCLSLYHEHPEPEFIASFNPYEYDLTTGTFRGGVREWSARKPSMFAVLFQKHTIARYIRALGQHCHLAEQVPLSVFIQEGYCVWIRHPGQFSDGFHVKAGYDMEVQL